MPLLDAAIAFSLTMLAVATAVSVLIEIAHSLLAHRSDGLRTFLQQFYERELQPALESGLDRAQVRLGGAAAQGLETVSRVGLKLRKELLDKAQDGGNANLPPAKSARAGQTVAAAVAEVDAYNLIEVGTTEMVDRLKQSELGQQIYAQLKDEADTVFDVIAERYERFGEVFSESFRKKRQTAAILVSLALAFAVNIDSIHLMKAYMLSGDTRDAVIAQASSILDASQQRQPVELSAEDPLRSAATLALARVNALEANPFPIGWQQFPGCPAGTGDPRCREQSSADAGYSRLLAWVSWGLGCLLTGLLAGLGAPFWYNAATSLMSAADKVRGNRQRLVAASDPAPAEHNPPRTPDQGDNESKPATV